MESILREPQCDVNAIFATQSNVILRHNRNVVDDLGWIRDGLNKPGKSQRGLAKALNVDPAAISRMLKGERQIKASELATIRAYLGSVETQPRRGTAAMPTHAVGSSEHVSGAVSIASGLQIPSLTGPRDLPILGYVKGGVEGFFVDNGNVQGYAVRPEPLLGVPNAYAVYVHDSSMSPAFEPGFLAFVDPARPAQPGDDCVIQLHDGQAFIKKLKRRTDKTWCFRQHNPPMDVEFMPSKVKSVHLIVMSTRRKA